MVRMSLAELLDPQEVAIAHLLALTVRRRFLFGQDPLANKNFDHRKVWIEDHLRSVAASCGIDLLGFAILSNPFHSILRSRGDVVAGWGDTLSVAANGHGNFSVLKYRAAQQNASDRDASDRVKRRAQKPGECAPKSRFSTPANGKRQIVSKTPPRNPK